MNFAYLILRTVINNCFCGNPVLFEQCCQPILAGQKEAKNAEQLMRSRFTAYVAGNFEYILKTYAAKQRTKLSVSELAKSAEGSKWLKLDVLAHRPNTTAAQVEFKAFYKVDSQFFVMHELSDFILEQGKWRYTTGAMQSGSAEFTPQRNSQCLCGSGKKFKKCCGK